MQAVALGASTSWIFLMVLLFCLKDVDTAISSTAGRKCVKFGNNGGADLDVQLFWRSTTKQLRLVRVQCAY